jgi:hypothetical protein
MNPLPGNPDLPPGVTERDVERDDWVFCHGCGRDVEKDKMDVSGLCERCLRGPQEDER